MGRWQASGLDAATFSRRERCNPRTLTYWRWRLGQSTSVPARRAPPRAVAFVEVVTPVTSPAPDVPVEVVLPAGYRLRLSPSVTTGLLHTVLTVLEAPR